MLAKYSSTPAGMRSSSVEQQTMDLIVIQKEKNSKKTMNVHGWGVAVACASHHGLQQAASLAAVQFFRIL